VTDGENCSGVLAVFQTPFRDDGSPDFATLAGEIDWIFDSGADGVVFGMVSEVLRLSSEERDAVAAEACRAVDGRGPCVISVGAESTAVAIRHARSAQISGADALMATPPALHPVPEAELLRYFTAIASAVEVPLIVQDASGYVGTPLSVTLQATLLEELGDRVMFKPESPPVGPRLSELLDATDGRARVFEGNGGLHLIDSFRRGVVGTMPAGEVVWAVAALWRALRAGDFDSAYRIGGPLALLVSMQTSLDSFVAVEKYLLAKQGVFPTRTVRGPVGRALDPATCQEIDRLVDLLRHETEAAGGSAASRAG
jgi:dihydrodipicolinate synthase/N-acetylneuraminate lyase